MSNLEYEIIGSILTDKSTHDFIEVLVIEDFTDAFCQSTLEAIKKLRDKDKGITLFNINKISGIPITDLARLQSSIATTANTEANIKLLKDEAGRRQLKAKASLILQMVDDNTKDISEIKNNIIEEIYNISEVGNDEVTTIRAALMETYALLEKRHQNKDDKGLYTGINKLDNLIAGLHQEELTTIAARPGVGKTILGLQLAINISNKGKKVLFTSLEMSTTQLGERFLASNTNVDSHKMRTGNIENANEWRMIQDAISRVKHDNLLLDKTSLNVQHIRTKLRKYKPELLIIDYLQLLHPATREHSREREVAVITRDLKRMTQEFNIPIVMLAQLNRNAEGYRPTKADLRESGAIEQDSDNVLFIHEPNDSEVQKLIDDGVYPITFFEWIKGEGYAYSNIIVEKQRNGPIGTIPVIKKPRYMRFEEVDNGIQVND